MLLKASQVDTVSLYADEIEVEYYWFYDQHYAVGTVKAVNIMKVKAWVNFTQSYKDVTHEIDQKTLDLIEKEILNIINEEQ